MIAPLDMCECGWWHCHHRWCGLDKKDERVCDAFRLKSTHVEFEAKRARHQKRMNRILAAQLAMVALLVVVTIYRAFFAHVHF